MWWCEGGEAGAFVSALCGGDSEGATAFGRGSQDTGGGGEEKGERRGETVPRNRKRPPLDMGLLRNFRKKFKLWVHTSKT